MSLRVVFIEILQRGIGLAVYWIIPILFFSISSLFSILGIGGSVLYIPILHWLGLDFQTEAIPLGLLLNIISSSTAAMTYIKNKLVNWEVAIPFGVAMILFAPLGAWLNMHASTGPVMLSFSTFMVASSISMAIDWQTQWRTRVSFQRLIWILSGSLMGFLTGLTGRGGGSVVMPLLYMLGMDLRTAAATSAIVITGGGLSSLLSHLALAARPDVLLWALSGASVFLGSRTGSLFMVRTNNPKGLQYIVSGLLVAMAVMLAAESLV